MEDLSESLDIDDIVDVEMGMTDYFAWEHQVLLLFILFVLLVCVDWVSPRLFGRIHYRYSKDVEEFSNNSRNRNRIKFLRDQSIYDPFYVNIYDMLVYNQKKNDFEIKNMEEATNMSPSESRILDVGSGTGHHVASFREKGYKYVTGLDSSRAMIDASRRYYPQYSKQFRNGNVLHQSLFNDDSFTHIMCLYFTIYEFKDKLAVFRNCRQWLLPGGFLVVHLVDREKFNPLVPMSMPYILVNPQTFAHERMTKSKVFFDQYGYEADFDLDEDNDVARITEKFTNRNTQKIFRKTEMTYYMESIDFILTLAKKEGFHLVTVVDMLKATCEYQYLYVFQQKT